jgi:type IV pilus assembly protein PilB
MRKFIGEILLEMEAVTSNQINEALSKQNAGDKRMIGQLLLEAEACTPEDIARALAEQFDMRFYDLESCEVPQKIIDLVPAELAREKLVIPVSLSGRTLTVAMANPIHLEDV